MIILHILEDEDAREQNCQTRKLMFPNLVQDHVEKFIMIIQYGRSKMLTYIQKQVILLCMRMKSIYLSYNSMIYMS